MHASELASGDFVHDLDHQLAIHFTSNCYPPIPSIMIPVAIEAINACNEGDYDHVIDLPDPVQFRGSLSVTATNAVDALFLHAWIGDQE
jgi:hypothetical protein